MSDDHTEAIEVIKRAVEFYIQELERMDEKRDHGAMTRIRWKTIDKAKDAITFIQSLESRLVKCEKERDKWKADAMKIDHFDRLCRNKLSRAQEENKLLKIKLNPRLWTKEMHDAWHKNLPDTQKAFEAISAIEKELEGVNSVQDRSD